MKLWNGFDVLLLFVLWFACMTALPFVREALYPYPSERYAVPSNEHPIDQLLHQGQKMPLVLAAAFFIGVVISPLTEEFLFRLLLQNWLSRYLRSAYLSLVITSFFFAALHGGSHGKFDAGTLFFVLAMVGIINAFVLSAGLFYLVRIMKIPMRQHLFQANWTWKGVLQLTSLFIVTILLTYALNFYLKTYLSANYPNQVSDPLPLFFFSLVLGFVYLRTRQLAPCFLMHAGLNALSIGLLLI
ncbi:hypothetical protein FACS189419_01000 [Planctomycetales bacterium]|nr:hypothetical protein FACS189419_01000 [Planctomycetales bacterium]